MPLTKTSYSMVAGAPANILDFGSSNDVGVLLNAAIAGGYDDIYIPESTSWTWNTVVTLPTLWRGRIWSDMSKSTSVTISAATGNNYPCIDAQGALFVEIEGLNVTGKTSTNESACFMVMARLTSGASAGNHKLTNNIISGNFYYCIIYNVGAEELVFLNNYFSHDATTNTVTYQNACVVHTLNEDSYFSQIVTKQARTNGSSCSAIKHIGDVVKNFVVGGSALYVGPNANDITFDLTYGYTADTSFFLSLGGYFDGIRLGVDRVETTKNSPIVYAPNSFDSGLVDIFKGSYRRSGAVNGNYPAVYINGTTSQVVNVNISPSVSWTSSYASNIEDTYLFFSARKTTCNISFLNGGVVGNLLNTKVSVALLVNSYIAMGLYANLTVTTRYGANSYWFFGQAPNTNSGIVFDNGLSVSGAATFLNGQYGVYPASVSSVNSTSASDHAVFLNPNGQVGSITTTGSSTAYITSSDYRLKNTVAPLTNALNKIALLKPCVYKWNADGSDGEGFIAHELAEVCPQAVTGEKDAVDKNGNPKYQGIDTSFLIATLTAGIQELKSDFEAYKASHP